MQTVTLDGTGTIDPENDPITYQWSVTLRPTGSTAALTATSGATNSLTPDIIGTYNVTLTPSDPYKVGTPATVSFTAFTRLGNAELQIQNAR